MSCLVLSTPPRLIPLSNNTVEMTAMVEALSFLGLHGLVDRDEQSCICYDSLHAAGISLGMIQARTHVQLALACQQSMNRAQHRLRLTMQHVYGHGGNLANERADNAAALGTIGVTSIHNVASRWIHNIFGASVCFDATNNISDSWNDCTAFEQTQRGSSQIGVSVVFTSGFIVFLVHLACISCCFVYSCCGPFPFEISFPRTVTDRLSSSAATVRSIVDYVERNMWNRCWKCFFSSRLVVIFASYLVENYLAKIVLSCHIIRRM